MTDYTFTTEVLRDSVAYSLRDGDPANLGYVLAHALNDHSFDTEVSEIVEAFTGEIGYFRSTDLLAVKAKLDALVAAIDKQIASGAA
ncbi:MAG: hypothetical protein DI640_13010 [Sphingomonas taxi]|uniref:Uncharacterized protein n=1 Tax=Sphingomonas taxi TaxID=1549858 RepID=A0A2W5AVY6_9SPHN|nr:MAG: hypothetical protein DI640_13010 [Sphingomonas taxi]